LFRKELDERFEQEIMRHVDAAYNLSLWLLRDPHDAEDATQSALYKAFRAFGRMRGADAKPWLLAIVRNECMDLLKARTVRSRSEHPTEEVLDFAESPEYSPEVAAIQTLDAEAVLSAINQLPPEFREVVVLREIEELSYKEIAGVIGKPVGTVMSRLARARTRLQVMLSSGGECA
jgi:RNA polymerase sigma-70 factor (ECF subfamily)